MIAPNEVLIRFPNKKLAESFVSWMSRQGEQSHFADSEICDEENPILAYQYHKENKKYALNDPKRYSKFDFNLIIAHDNASLKERCKVEKEG